MAVSFKKLFDVLIGSQVLRGCLFGASGNSATAFTRDPRVPNLWWVNVGANRLYLTVSLESNIQIISPAPR